MGIRVALPDLDHWKAQVKCQAGCPVSTDAGRYVQLIAEGRLEDAYLVARAPNPLASVCGRVCAAPCEDACRRGAIDAPVSIRALKRHVTEQYGVESVRPDTQDRLRDTGIAEGNRYPGHLPMAFHRTAPTPVTGPRHKVAVIGAGPAGLAAAHDLALLQYDVTIFEAAAEPGGMMRFGIPEYRLPRTLLAAEIDRIVSLGVELKLNAPLSPSFGLRHLREAGFEAVFLSVGVSRGRDLQIPGVEMDGVVKAVDYLLNVNRGYRLNLGRRVVVIGGGFVAFDAARTALRAGREAEPEATAADLGAESDARLKEAMDSARAALRGGATEVTVVSLESLDEMPVLRTTQGHEEFEEAAKEGVRFITRKGPRRLLGNGHVIDASLGYFITPLVNVLLGHTVLHERPRAPQWAALALATAGVLWLTVQAGQLPWIALVLAATFGSYGLMRKVAVLGALEGLTLETMLLAPAAIVVLAWLLMHGSGSFPAPDTKTNLLLLGIGPLTAIPLLLFAAGARRISMTTLGLLQYLGPTIQFLLGVWLFNEPFTTARGIGFAFIWAGLVAYTWDGWRTSRLRAAAAAA